MLAHLSQRVFDTHLPWMFAICNLIGVHTIIREKKKEREKQKSAVALALLAPLRGGKGVEE